MAPSIIDLRSDTVTKPTPGMRAAMAAAEVGDDVIDVDPSCERLEQMTAKLLGKEAAIFMPSGSMSNQIAVRIHCKPGDEFLCESGCHIYNYEQGAFAQLSGVVARTFDGEQGVLTVDQLKGTVRPWNDHLVRTRMVCLENTHNRGAGRVQPFDVVKEISDWGRSEGLRVHLDGARLMNAVAASGIAADRWCDLFDTVSICFSKGLGAPIGSALAGPKEMIVEARRHRKLFGGAMRQVGVIASAAAYALEHHVARLVDDHANAQILATAVSRSEHLTLLPVDTNIIIFKVNARLGGAAIFAAELKSRGVLCFATSPTQIRLVTHLDVTAEECQTAGEIIVEVAQDLAAGVRRAQVVEAAY